MTTNPPTVPTTANTANQVAGIDITTQPGVVGPESAARWAGRSNALTAWLLSEWNREQAEPAVSESLPARLDPAPCPATPRPDVEGAPRAA